MLATRRHTPEDFSHHWIIDSTNISRMTIIELVKEKKNNPENLIKFRIMIVINFKVTVS